MIKYRNFPRLRRSTAVGVGAKGKFLYFISFHNSPACAVARRGSWVASLIALSLHPLQAAATAGAAATAATAGAAAAAGIVAAAATAGAVVAAAAAATAAAAAAATGTNYPL